jgi:hypothetical protein
LLGNFDITAQQAVQKFITVQLGLLLEVAVLLPSIYSWLAAEAVGITEAMAAEAVLAEGLLVQLY